ncbi:cholinesterase 1-like [Belonocnema kinseyi]|uniref:cholinesterase 1-like n=1 Tax=Belonocnema kinseyi TaxID=2817044 RepID=UPI00143D748D|nr:cholinesterase 1-like [Belonocnema kinseyi]
MSARVKLARSATVKLAKDARVNLARNTRNVRGSTKQKLLPVMVWIFGGGFYVGSSDSTIYGPNYLLDQDVILVSMNYRLGVLGFFTTGDSIVPGNMGLKDQALALKWVKENIQLFGGDRNRVTLFGQSSAGACVNLHALSDLSQGLFNQYIIESGTAFTGWAYRNRNEFKPHIDKLAETVGCPAGSSKILLKCLRGKSVDSLVSTFVDDLYDFSKLIWIPTDEIKSKNAFLSDSPINLIKKKKMKDVPSMSGTCVDDGLSTTLNFYLKPADDAAIKKALDQYMTTTIQSFHKSENLPKMRNIVNSYYFKNPVLENKNKLLKSFTKFASDSRFKYPEYILLENMATVMKNPFYAYSFGYRADESLVSLNYGLKGNIGVTHSEEVIKPTSKLLSDQDLWQPYSKEKSFLQIGDLSNNNNPAVTLQHRYFAEDMDFWKKNFPV